MFRLIKRILALPDRFDSYVFDCRWVFTSIRELQDRTAAHNTRIAELERDVLELQRMRKDLDKDFTDYVKRTEQWKRHIEAQMGRIRETA